MSVYAQLLPAAAKLLLVMRDLDHQDTPTRDDLMGEAGIASVSHYYAAMRQLRELRFIDASPSVPGLSTALGQRGVAEAQRWDWRESQRDDRQDLSGVSSSTNDLIYDRGARKTAGRASGELLSGPVEAMPSERSTSVEAISGPTEAIRTSGEAISAPVEALEGDVSSLLAELEAQCADADEMDATGEWSVRNSPRNLRRKRQVELLQQAWALLFPRANPIIEANLKTFLHRCEDYAYEVVQVWITVERHNPQNPVTYGLAVAAKWEDKRAKEQGPALDPLDEKHELSQGEREEIDRARRVAKELWGEDETW